MKLTKKQVQHISQLAKLNNTLSETTKFQTQLSNILQYIELMNKIDTAHSKPTAQVTNLENITRKDKINGSQTLSQPSALSNSPEKKDGYFKIKSVF